MKRASLSACALVVLFGACKSSSTDSQDSAVDTGAGGDTAIIQKNDASPSDTLPPAVDTAADTVAVQKVDTGLADTPSLTPDASQTLAETGGTALEAGADLGVAPQGDARDAAKDTAGDTSADATLTVDGSSPDSSAATCGTNGQACCVAPADLCQTDLTCLLGASCSCAKGIFGSYIIRADGVVLQMPTTATGAQTPVLDADTAQPVTGVVAGYEAYNSNNTPSTACAVKNDGSVWCWRAAANGNQYGGLGNGTTDTNGTTFRATQVLVSANTPLTSVKSIAPNAPCAITNGGNLYCWGDLTWLVGNGTSLISSYAQVITTDGATPLAGVKEISVGLGAQCALIAGATNNEVWCWGYNVYSNLGTGDTTNRRYPTKILGLTNPEKIAVSYGQYAYTRTANCAIDGGNVLCWGYNAYGATGVGNKNTPVSVPTLVKLQDGTTPLSNISALYPAPDRFCALRTGNTVWCWGQGFAAYADTIGLTNVVDVGTAWGNRTWLTSDGVYHSGTVTISPKCGSLK
jgi:hypothetical protein